MLDFLSRSFHDLLRSQAETKSAVRILPDHVSPPEDDRPLSKSGTGYYRLWLASMFLQHDRFLHRELFPAIRSDITFKYGDNSLTTSTVVSPSAVLQAGKEDAQNIAIENQPLTPLVPFNGGTIGVNVGLVSMKGDNALQGFLAAMEDFSKLVVASQISTVLTSIEHLNAGIDRLFELGRDELVVGFSATYASQENSLDPGYIALINRPRDEVDADQLFVKDSTLLIGRMGDADVATPYLESDYMLIRIETAQRRDDWAHIGKIDELVTKAINQVSLLDKDDNMSVPDGLIRSAILEAYTSPDLSKEQRPYVAAAIREEYMEAREDIETHVADLDLGSTDGAAGPSGAESLLTARGTLQPAPGAAGRPPSLRRLLQFD